MIKNFLFHRVSPEKDRLWPPMSPDRFEWCVRWIKENYQIEILEHTVNSYKKQDGSIATIMFDDGFKDNITYALPILTKYNIKASFYVVTDCVDNNIPTWTYILDYIYQNPDVSFIELNSQFSNEIPTHFDTQSYAKEFKKWLKKAPNEIRNEVTRIMTEFIGKNNLPQIMMDWSDLNTLMQKGHYIGSHTASHPMLGNISQDDHILYELEKSKQRINTELNHNPISISYPIGSFNSNVMKLAKRAGYDIGLAVNQKSYVPARDDIMQIPRIEVYQESLLKTKLRMNGTLQKAKIILGKA